MGIYNASKLINFNNIFKQFKFLHLRMIQYLIFLMVLMVLWRMIHGEKYAGTHPRMDGKFVLITGGTSGVGRQLVMSLSKLGCSIIFGGRNAQNGRIIVADVIQKTGNDKVKFIKFDLADRKSIQNFANNVDFEKIDVLINNAGIMWINQQKLNNMGFQMHRAVNYQGHFYLTYLLWQKLQKSEFFRIINTSSIAHVYSNIICTPTTLNFDNLNFENGNYQSPLAYARSKLYVNFFTKALSEKINRKKGIAVTIHPGIIRTNIIREAEIVVKFCKIFMPIYACIVKTPTEGCQTQFFIMFSNPQCLKNGGYYTQYYQEKQNPLVLKENWDKMWKLSSQSWGVDFDKKIVSS